MLVISSNKLFSVLKTKQQTSHLRILWSQTEKLCVNQEIISLWPLATLTLNSLILSVSKGIFRHFSLKYVFSLLIFAAIFLNSSLQFATQHFNKTEIWTLTRHLRSFHCQLFFVLCSCLLDHCPSDGSVWPNLQLHQSSGWTISTNHYPSTTVLHSWYEILVLIFSVLWSKFSMLVSSV